MFLARHGYGHTIPPHQVNYRANMWALQAYGVENVVVSVASVGGIRADLAPGDADAFPTRSSTTPMGAVTTSTAGGAVIHIDFTLPYSTELRKRLHQGGGARAGNRSSMAASMPQRRDRASRRRPKSTGWSATARTWSA